MATQPSQLNDPAGAPPPAADAEPAPILLVVDDNPVDRRLAAALVEQGLGWPVIFADNGRTALAALDRERPQVILTDLMMPEMDGLALAAAVRQRSPGVPVILMTAFGNEEVAMQALREGAASYVPKRSLDRYLVPTLEQVVAAAQEERRHRQLLEQVEGVEIAFSLENDASLIPALVAHVQPYLTGLGLCDPTQKVRVGVSLEEALINALYHGNLEVSSDLRQRGDEPYRRLIRERRRQGPYRDRRVRCSARLSRQEAVYVITDEGPGFDPATLPDPRDPANLEKAGGRGLLLIRTFMDEVLFNRKGNQITLIKRRKGTPIQPESTKDESTTRE